MSANLDAGAKGKIANESRDDDSGFSRAGILAQTERDGRPFRISPAGGLGICFSS
jgi:hypothetical protein